MFSISFRYHENGVTASSKLVGYGFFFMATGSSRQDALVGLASTLNEAVEDGMKTGSSYPRHLDDLRALEFMRNSVEVVAGLRKIPSGNF